MSKLPIHPWLQPTPLLLWRWTRRFLIAGLILAAGWASWKGLGIWAQQRLVTRAKIAIERGDLLAASLNIRHAHQINRNNVEIVRTVAELAEKIGSPEAVLWRNRLVQVEPGNLENRLALANAALRFNELILADRTLDAMPESARNTGRWQHAAGTLAVLLHRPDAAEAHLTRANRLDPSNTVFRLDLATLRMQSSKPGTATAARQEIEEVSAQPEFRSQTLRALLADALARNDGPAALAFADRLVSVPAALYQDRVIRLGTLYRFQKTGFPEELQRLQTLAGRVGSNVYELTRWMNANGLSREAATWIEGRPIFIRRNPIAALALVETYEALGDWKASRHFLDRSVWPGLEFSRLAHLARAASGLGEPVNSRRIWKSAMAAAADDPVPLMMLARLCEKWKWPSELKEVCWKVARHPRHARWALMTAFRTCRETGDTRGMLQAVRRASEIMPSDAIAQNNTASLSLLLGEDLAASRRTALDLHASSPSNTAYAATCAFALHLNGETRRALELLAALPPGQLLDPHMAAYQGILLAAAGDLAAAQKCLDLAKGARLLPEEQRLVNEARARIKSASPTKPAK